MTIPFTQFVLPHGHQRREGVERSPEIEALAHDYIDRGGWFEREILTTGHVSLTACWDRADGNNDVDIEIVPNGPGVGEAVDRLVKRVARRKDLL